MIRLLRHFGQFWYDFIVGDDWKIAAVVVAVLAVGAGLVVAGLGGSAVLSPTLAVAIAAGFCAVVLVDTRSR